MSVGALIFEIIANTGRFETDTGRAAKIAEKRAKEIERSFSAMGAKIGKALALVGGPTGLGLLIKNSIDASAELDDLSQKTGIAVESLSRLQYAAGREGVEDLGGSLAKLAKNIATNAELFDIIGVKTKDASGQLRSAEDVFKDIAEVFAKSPDGIRKTALAMEIFGKSGAALIPLLNQGRAGLQALGDEADRTGNTISSNTAKAADEFNNNMFALKGSIKGAVNEITEGLLPSLNRISEAMVSAGSQTTFFEKAGRALGVVFETITVLGANVAYVIEQIGITLGGLYAIQTKVLTGDVKGAVNIWKEMAADAEAARKEIDAFSDSVLKAKKASEASPKSDDKTGSNALPDIEAIKKARDEAVRAAKKAADDVQKEREKQLQENAAAEEKQRESIASVIDALKDESATMGLTNAQIQARTLAKLGATDAEVKQAYELAKYIDLQKAAEEADKERAAVLKETRTYAEVYADEIARLNVLFANGTKDSAIYNRAVAGAQDAFDKAEKAAEESTNSMSAFADQAARNMQDAFADFLFDPFDGGVKGMVRSFAQALQRMAAEALAANIFGSLTKGASGSGGLFSSLFSLGASYFSGGVSATGTYTAANIAGRAIGGPVMAGTPYVVGERGPELMVPKTAGTIVPNDMMGGKQQNIRIVNAFDTNVIADYMNSSAGEETFLNLARRNGTKLRNYTAS